MASAEDVRWHDLRDGLEFHAVHVRQLADSTLAASAALARASGAAGRFVWAPHHPSETLVNSIEPDDQNLVIDLMNIAVLTDGGYLAHLPPPKKSFAVPRTGGESYLNLYVTDYQSGSGETEARWEQRPPTDARGVALARWANSERKFKLLPLPHTIGVVHQVATAFQQLQATAEKLRLKLLGGGQSEYHRLSLSRQQATELGPLIAQLQRLTFVQATTPVSAVLVEARMLAAELTGWFQYLRAKADVRSSALAQPDALGRAVFGALGAGGLAEYMLPLASEPTDGQQMLEWVTALGRGLEGFHRVISGDSDEDPLTAFATFVPEPWPAGMGYRYSLENRGSEVTLRCEVTAHEEPEMMWGIGPAQYLPALTPALLNCVEPGRYQVQLGPVRAQDADAVVVVLDTAGAALRVYALNQ
ncbi:MAG: hypothetical protein RJA70_1654 [Pseudomonadota bacterium]